MKNEILIEKDYPVSGFRCISWSAIIVGALVAVGLSFLLNLFGLALGLTAFSTARAGEFMVTIGGLIGVIITILVAMGVAGYTAGYLGRGYTRCNLGILYGFATWTLALILSAAVAAHINHYTVTYAKALGVNVSNTTTNTTNVTTGTDNRANDQNQDSNRVTANPKELATAAFLLFVLFFLGAFATCVGACWAMGCLKDRDEDRDRERVRREI